MSVDLDNYLARIGYSGPLGPTIETLRGLHLSHALGIPFENLDILLGKPISLDLDRLQAKLVTGRRGGYCFEHNTLFAAMLESLGFRVTRLAARVRFGTTMIRPRSHMLLSIEVDGEPWLADVGFGGEGLLSPIRLRDDEESTHGAWRFRIERVGEVYVLKSLHADGWFDLYAFTTEPQYPIDFVVANHFTSTYPRSPFVQSLIVQRTGLEARLTLHNLDYAKERPADRMTIYLPDHEALLRILANDFSLHFPKGTRFRLGPDESLS